MNRSDRDRKRYMERGTMFCLIIAILLSLIVFALSMKQAHTDAEPVETENVAPTELKSEISAQTKRVDPITTITESEVVTDVVEKDVEEVFACEEKHYEAIDIPLSAELQEYTFNLCEEANVNFPMVLGIMRVESNFTENVISKTNDYGIMQINKCNHSWLAQMTGVKDFNDPKQNIKAAMYMLENLTKKYESPHKILMAYHFGEGGAKKLWNQGIYSSKYSNAIMGCAAEYEELLKMKNED